MAQEASSGSGPPPVLNPESSINGVDMVTGAYSYASPLGLSAPAAGVLQYRSTANGWRLSPSPAAMPGLYEAPSTTSIKGWEWLVTVSTGGGSYSFDCEFDGTQYLCQLVDDNRGVSLAVTSFTWNASLGRADPKSYTFVGRDGSTFVFGSAAIQLFTENNPLNGYIDYYLLPSGEKVTNTGTSVVPATLISNLGYTLKTDTPQILKGTTVLSSLTVSKTVSGGTTTFTETDALSRTFTASWEVYLCSATYKHHVASTTSPGGLVTSLTYSTTTSKHRTQPVTGLTRGGVNWTYTPNFSGNSISLAWPEGGSTTVTSNVLGTADSSTCADGNSTIGMVQSVSDPLSRTSSYSWIDSQFLGSATQPEGGGAAYTYDDRGNLLTVTRKAKPGSGISDSVIYQASYSATPSGYDRVCADADRKVCNQPLWEKDALGNQTDYTYYSHGGKKTVTLPADVAGYRLRTFYTYTAYNTGDGLIQRLTRTETCGLLSTELSLTACPTTRSGSDVRHLTQVTVTDYGTSTTAPNTYNTFLPYQMTKTDGGSFLSATVTYAYDAWGRVTSVDGPLASTVDVTYTTYDSVGRKVFEIGADPDGGGALLRSAVKHTYNVDDQETKTETGTVTGTDGSGFVVSSFTRMTYDTLGRLTKTETVQP
ncbi:hypothetical protein ABAC460_11265 [Asticcacaulis sp. AC460]|uniref:hypothetical protein n=1 Tax=Asticcacaulis sp. AC460 TaxID=1282360 RepID=UPI0003C3D3A5|nr:hypothetical protein [Asticcacaulis sp. AC460]ESQ89874.1 hypothetical protein ABAC460_11265 [Asticcacaulis sp. AC460]